MQKLSLRPVLTQEIPDHHISINHMSAKAERGNIAATGPDVTTITNAVVLYHRTIGAVFPLQTGDISLLKDSVGRATALVMAEPHIQINRDRGHHSTWIAIVRGIAISLTMNFQHWDRT